MTLCCKSADFRPPIIPSPSVGQRVISTRVLLIKLLFLPLLLLTSKSTMSRGEGKIEIKKEGRFGLTNRFLSVPSKIDDYQLEGNGVHVTSNTLTVINNI